VSVHAQNFPEDNDGVILAATAGAINIRLGGASLQAPLQDEEAAAPSGGGSSTPGLCGCCIFIVLFFCLIIFAVVILLCHC
jgi:cobalamin biosynthesis protein CobD/CbiB